MDFDKTEIILIKKLKKLKHLFETTGCNKKANVYLKSYQLIKNELISYNPNIKIVDNLSRSNTIYKKIK